MTAPSRPPETVRSRARRAWRWVRGDWWAPAEIEPGVWTSYNPFRGFHLVVLGPRDAVAHRCALLNGTARNGAPLIVGESSYGPSGAHPRLAQYPRFRDCAGSRNDPGPL